MKPILFSTPMVQAILDGRKSMTRRVVKNKDIINAWDCESDGTPIAYIEPETGDHYPATRPAPYQTGDILWVRETWCNINKPEIALEYYYRADAVDAEDYDSTEWKWRPSLFMPETAARIFLRVKEVRCERLQEITEEDAKKEGAPDCRPFECSTGIRPRTINCFIACSYRDGFSLLWNSLNAKPKPQYAKVDGKRTIVSYISYPWEDIQETRTHQGKPWYVCGNPWVWVYSFRKIHRLLTYKTEED